MGFSEVINVQISLQASTIAGANFGVALILGSSNRFTQDTARTYSTLAGMVADGFLVSDPEYLAAAALIEQVNVPPFWLVGQMGSEVAQVDYLTVNTDTSGDTYNVTIHGVTATFTSSGDGTSATATGIAAAIHALTSTMLVDATAVGSAVHITANQPGDAFSVTLGGTGAALMSDANHTPNYGVQESLTLIQTSGATWYESLLVSRAGHDILNLAAWTEPTGLSGTPHIALAQSSESNGAGTAVNPSGTDVANVLHHLNYRRTSYWWHSLDSEYLDAAISGRELPLDPGTDNWALKGLSGVSPDALSDTQKSNLFGPPGQPGGKQANAYYPLLSGGQNPITNRGTMASGDWIDVIRFIDFLVNRIQVTVANLFLSVEKVEFDETGLNLIAAQVSGVLKAAKDAGKITSYSVNVPAISSISPSDRAARRLNPPITFSAQFSGAFNYAQVSGVVTE